MANKLDLPGKEDADVNNNGVDNDPSDKYIMKRRRAISKAMGRKGREDSSQDLFIDEVMARVEENILLEEEHIQNVLSEAEENGIDVDYLTEEELSELFGFGMDRSTSRSRTARARMTAPEGSRRRNRAEGRVARRKRQKSQRAAMMDRLARVSAERKAAKAGADKPAVQKPAVEKPTRRTPGDRTPKGPRLAAPEKTIAKDEFGGLVKDPRSGGVLKKKVDAPKPLGRRRQVSSTDIIRGSRLALAERVFDSLLNRED